MVAQSPTVSIITAVLNQAGAMEKTLASVHSQDYGAIEHIVIDGGSTDGTVALLEQSPAVQWCSEPDEGIADAFNKGIAKARGDYLYFIGAGDYLWSECVIGKMMQGVDVDKDTLVCGRIARPTSKGFRIVPSEHSPAFRPASLRYKMALPHQGLFTHRRFFEQYGLFDRKLRYAMDYEILLRAYGDFPRIYMKKVIVAAWLAGGIGADCTDAVYAEYRRIKGRHQIAPPWMLDLIHHWNTLKYRLKESLLPSE
jgi:glycosyltransferase involved in cell wall biosynthesis